jgi:hypothetical protein
MTWLQLVPARAPMMIMMMEMTMVIFLSTATAGKRQKLTIHNIQQKTHKKFKYNQLSKMLSCFK